MIGPSAPGLTVEIRQLSLDGVPLFRDLRLDVRAGKWTALVGDAVAARHRALLDLMLNPPP